nr:MAG TPA: hypothetical protein [Caudoviricetes sp.]
MKSQIWRKSILRALPTDIPILYVGHCHKCDICV